MVESRAIIARFGGGGGNRTAGSSPDSDESRTVSGTGIDENTSKEHEQNALPDILMTMSQIPDVNQELAEVGAMFAVFPVCSQFIFRLGSPFRPLFSMLKRHCSQCSQYEEAKDC